VGAVLKFAKLSGCTTLVVAGSLALAGSVEAQVGISSGAAPVTLVANAPLQGSLEGLVIQPGIGLPNQEHSGTITLRVSANSGYRLVVRGGGELPPDARIWVRSVSGEFQEVMQGSSVVVADDAHPAGIEERRVEYRIQGAGDETVLPVRYELQINPAI
jgi:hypothetical protein